MQVVNKRTHAPTSNDVYIGRPSELGNPFVIGKDGSRLEVIEKYRQWLWSQVQRPDSVAWTVITQELTDNSILVCFCSPEPCHGDVIIKAYNWYFNREV